MKPKYDTLIQPLNAWFWPSWTQSVIANYTWMTDIVSPSGIIHGDFQHPNAWAYAVTFLKEQTGDAYYYQGTFGDLQAENYQTAAFNGMLRSLPKVTYDDFDESPLAYSKALGRLNEKVRGGLDISIDLAESHQTRSMVKSIHTFERWFQKFGPRRWANEWLSYRYGWKPLLQDIYSAADELITYNNANTTFKASAKIEKQPSGSKSSPAGIDVSGQGHWTTRPVSTAYEGETLNTCRLVVDLMIPNESTYAARWTSLNPMSIAWELTPYSFVVDWFIDIGSYLRDMETFWLYNSMFRSGYKSELYRCSIESKLNDYVISDMKTYASEIKRIFVSQKRRAVMKRIAFNRSILTSYPCPNLPRVNTDLSPGRLITAAALLAQFLPVPKPVKAQWMDQMRPFISYGQLKKPKFAFKPTTDWSHELRW